MLKQFNNKVILKKSLLQTIKNKIIIVKKSLPQSIINKIML